MWLPIHVYKKSAIGTFSCIVGATLALAGFALIIENSRVAGVILIVVGIALWLIAEKMASLKQKVSRDKYLRRPEFIKKIEDSALEAYYLYEHLPESKTLRYIQKHNAYAAEKIILVLRYEMTAEEAIQDLEAYDAEQRKRRS